VIQYIELVNPDSDYVAFSTSQGGVFPFLPPDEFGQDDEAGHGTHTAGSAAGATLNDPAETTTCLAGDETLGCAGACIDESESTDDLVSSYLQSVLPDLDRLCPMYGCDDSTDPCLSDEVDE
ncbi:unnamed protein product, partial [Ectocarpus fasciculatus]